MVKADEEKKEGVNDEKSSVEKEKCDKGFENLVQAVTLGGRFTIGVETHKYVKECVNDEKPSVEKSEQSF